MGGRKKGKKEEGEVGLVLKLTAESKVLAAVPRDEKSEHEVQRESDSGLGHADGGFAVGHELGRGRHDLADERHALRTLN